jgi:hypothetical protein
MLPLAHLKNETMDELTGGNRFSSSAGMVWLLGKDKMFLACSLTFYA